MSLSNVIRSGVAVANKVTGSLQDLVTIKQWTAQDFEGTPAYGKVLKVPGIVELGEKQYTLTTGVTIAVKATVTFLQPIAQNGAPGRVEPIDDRDLITLPDGTTGPTVLGLPAIVDPATHKPYFQTVGIGK